MTVCLSWVLLWLSMRVCRYEGRDVGTKSADEQVADLEATYVRGAQQEVVNSLGLAVALNFVFFFAVGAVFLWYLSGVIFGAIAPTPDPLAF